MHYPDSLGVGGGRHVGTSSLTQTKPTTTPTTTTTLEMYAPTSPTTDSLPVESTVPEQDDVTTPTTTPAAPESFALGSSSPSSSTSRRGRRRGCPVRHRPGRASQEKEKGDSGASVSNGSCKSHPQKPPPRVSSLSCPDGVDCTLDDTTSFMTPATTVPDPPTTTTSSDSLDNHDDDNHDNTMGSGNLSGLSDQAIRKMAELLKMAPWLRHFQVSDDMMQQHGMIGPLRNEDLERQLLDELGVNRRNTKQEDDDDETESVLSESPYWKQDQLRHEYRQTKGALQHWIAECIQRRIQERLKEEDDKEQEQEQEQEQDNNNDDDDDDDDKGKTVTVNKQKDKDHDKDESTVFQAIVQCEPHIPKRVRPI